MTRGETIGRQDGLSIENFLDQGGAISEAECTAAVAAWDSLNGPAKLAARGLMEERARPNHDDDRIGSAWLTAQQDRVRTLATVPSAGCDRYKPRSTPDGMWAGWDEWIAFLRQAAAEGGFSVQ